MVQPPLLGVFLCCCGVALCTLAATAPTTAAGGGGPPYPPSDPQATAAARSLLSYLYGVTGKHTITGQNMDDKQTQQSWDNVFRITGKHPGVYGVQFLWGLPADQDPIRAQMVRDVIRLYSATNSSTAERTAETATASSHVIPHINFHLCPPMPEFRNENCTWKDINQGRPPSLIDAVLANGSEANQQWLASVDRFAQSLADLQRAGVPLLWRPFHEMNGDWFWWGRQPRFAELWRQLYDRLTKAHQLHNLLWVFSPNGPHGSVPGAAGYYPGDAYVDVVGEDVYVGYGDQFSDAHYDELLQVGQGRPIALCEVGQAPNATLLRTRQPKYTYFLMWHGYETNPKENTPDALRELYNDPWVLNEGDVSF